MTIACLASEPPAPGSVIKLWPADAPGEKGGLPEEADTTKPTDNKVAGKPVMRIGNVSQPTITMYPAPKDIATGAAVLVCPGGGYNILAWDLEGTEVCEWLNSIGVTGVLLKYRVPKRPDTSRELPPLQDAQRAMGIIRSKAADWGIDPSKVGVLGFSAGGNLAAHLCNTYEQRKYDRIDLADDQNCRPDFSVLIYGAYFNSKEQPLQLTVDMKVNAKTPPAFLVHAQDDKVPAENSIAYFLALKNAGVKGELHVYPSGGHGYGLRPTNEPVTGWPKLAEAWLRGLGALDRK
jgi:acetyl esterase/lipase